MKKILILPLFLLVLSAFAWVSPTSAEPNANKIFTLTSVIDEIDELAGDGKCNSTPSQKCTLRAAVMEARALGGNVTVLLSANNDYILSRVGNDDSGQNGDLDLTGNVNLTLVGNNIYDTIIDANQIDRLFDLDGGAQLTLKYLTVQNGKTADAGGAFISGNSSLTLDHVILKNNESENKGGAIYAGGSLTIRDTMIRDNRATNNSDGGAIYIYGSDPSLFVNASFYNNTASTYGGAVYNDGTLVMVNSTFSQNQADRDGGGIYNTGTVTLANVTLSENIADADANDNGDGGGAFNDSGASFNVRNSIFAGNQDHSPSGNLFSKPYNCKGTFTSEGYNLVTVTGGCSGFANGVNGDQTGTALFPGDAKLYPFGISGVRGRYNLKSDSPAVNAGNPNGCFDQNNNALTFDTEYLTRPVNGCDIGASEYDGAWALPLPPELFTPTNGAKLKQTKVKLLWQDNVDAPTTFNVIIKQDSQKGPNVDSQKNIVDFQYTTKALPKGKTYFGRITACNPTGCTKGAWFKFSIKP